MLLERVLVVVDIMLKKQNAVIHISFFTILDEHFLVAYIERHDGECKWAYVAELHTVMYRRPTETF